MTQFLLVKTSNVDSGFAFLVTGMRVGLVVQNELLLSLRKRKRVGEGAQTAHHENL